MPSLKRVEKRGSTALSPVVVWKGGRDELSCCGMVLRDGNVRANVGEGARNNRYCSSSRINVARLRAMVADKERGEVFESLGAVRSNPRR